ncbi:hypothetical protein LAZ67_15002842 [Cordylochernes scorpioides]|uniref:RNA-directed DNA polymerase n=1 Tax=Cordylochernes scorpioides TaxID=51811 RepID=A0ABY6LA45_9ARAC|nr:hypothetical protein LAZ67_15002842 [Cordylochernes scorpioides]
MPSTHKATTASIYNDNAQNVSVQQHSSHNYHTKFIRDHTSSRNNHANVPHNKHDIHNNKTQTTSIQQDGFHANNTRVHTSSHNDNTHNQHNKRDTHTKRRQQPTNTCTNINNTTIPSTQNIEKIHATKQPHSRKTLRSFLNAVNAYKEFIPDHARLRTPLVNLLKKDVMWVWDDECQKAFTSLKESLTTHPTLHLYQEGLPCQVYYNTSTLGIAGTLKQVYPDGKTYTVQHFSRSLRAHERSYSDLELQCLAIVESVDNFRACLMGRKFTILSDHPALQWLKGIKAPSGRLFRWRLRLSRYEYEVRSINGVQQYETGVVTRIPFCGFLDAPLLRSQQSSPPGKSCVTMDHNGLHTVSRKGVLKTIVPNSLTARLLKSVHTQHHHPNISKMTRLISSQYYWQNMTQDIAKQSSTVVVGLVILSNDVHGAYDVHDDVHDDAHDGVRGGDRVCGCGHVRACGHDGDHVHAYVRAYVHGHGGVCGDGGDRGDAHDDERVCYRDDDHVRVYDRGGGHVCVHGHAHAYDRDDGHACDHGHDHVYVRDDVHVCDRVHAYGHGHDVHTYVHHVHAYVHDVHTYVHDDHTWVRDDHTCDHVRVHHTYAHNHVHVCDAHHHGART